MDENDTETKRGVFRLKLTYVQWIGYILPLCTERLDEVQTFLRMKRDMLSSQMNNYWANMVDRNMVSSQMDDYWANMVGRDMVSSQMDDYWANMVGTYVQE